MNKMNTKEKNSIHLDPLLLLRGFACLVVVWSHTVPPPSWLTLFDKNGSFLFDFSGKMAVYIFYLLSGYSIGYGFFSRKYHIVSIKTYFAYLYNRWLRIAPAYYILILVCALFIYTSPPISLVELIRWFTFTANYGYLSTIHFLSPLVILSTEMQFYFVAPLLYGVLNALIPRVRIHILAMCIILLGPLIRYILWQSGFVEDAGMFSEHVYVSVFGELDIFVYGMFISYLVLYKQTILRSLKARIPSVIYWIALIACVLLVNWRNNYVTDWSKVRVFDLFIIPSLITFLFGWGIAANAITGSLYHPTSLKEGVFLFFSPKTFLSAVGMFSYGIYLIHYLFIDMVYAIPYHSSETMIHFLYRFFSVCICSFIFSVVSHYAIERPLQRYKMSS
jgi:peptidoglycan/LPS O-acetylase OafA/YrhL